MPVGKRLEQAHVRVHTEVPDLCGHAYSLCDLEPLVTNIGIVLTFAGDGDLAGCFNSPNREVCVTLRKGARPTDVAEALRALAALLDNEGV